jgi:hypothetical protein
MAETVEASRMKRVGRYFRELGEGFRVGCSRSFWRAFRAYYSREQIAARLDAFTQRVNDRYGR